MDYLYDPSSADSIEAYAEGLKGKTFQAVIEMYTDDDDKRTAIFSEYCNKARKGGLGNLLEKYYFNYEPNNDQNPDFPEAGVELKVTPYERKKNGELSAGERLVITMINYDKPYEPDFYKSHAWEKMRQMLIVWYCRNRAINRNLLYEIGFVHMFRPPQSDLVIIREDYCIIRDKVTAGLAHELSESDTHYLGACPKGATALASLVKQGYSDVLAKSRAFCFKHSYMTYILNHYANPKTDSSESILHTGDMTTDMGFERCIEDKINQYRGKTDRHLCDLLGRIYDKNKSMWVNLTYRMLGIKGNRAEEFQKANIKVKVIRIEENNKMNECISLPPFKFMDVARQTWEGSDVRRYFDETMFFFVIFKRRGDYYELQGAKFWHMPYSDMEGTARQEWDAIRNVIVSGVQFTVKDGKVRNNLPGISDTKILHIRPHAKRAAYRLSIGFECGNIERDANILPDGQYMSTQSFWIKNEYILEQLGKNDAEVHNGTYGM